MMIRNDDPPLLYDIQGMTMMVITIFIKPDKVYPKITHHWILSSGKITNKCVCKF